MKKRTKIISALLMSALILQNITGTPANDLKIYADSAAITEIPGTVKTEESINGSFLSVSGFAKGNISVRSMYGEILLNTELFLHLTNFFRQLMMHRTDLLKL